MCYRPRVTEELDSFNFGNIKYNASSPQQITTMKPEILIGNCFSHTLGHHMTDLNFMTIFPWFLK